MNIFCKFYMNMYFSYRMGDGAREIMKAGEEVIGKDGSRLMCWPHTRYGCHLEPENYNFTCLGLVTQRILFSSSLIFLKRSISRVSTGIMSSGIYCKVFD